jgi:2-polyprenyl-3-methyl-5-hydroxy-6-metoxy-1,4-benzoquinol methylase
MTCKVCSGKSEIIFKAKVLEKYDVGYYQCTNCRFIQTEDPYWLPEAYNNAITSLDIGLLSRNNMLLPVAKTIISTIFNKNEKFIDYAGGYGVFVRLMRDAGYDFYRQDIYCENIFAKEFDISDNKGFNGKYELLTAFEVFEHLINPLEEIEKMLAYSDNIFFSTELQPEKEIRPDTWWYVTPETGQHIAFYTVKALEVIAAKYGLHLYTNGTHLHLFTKKKVSAAYFNLLTKQKVARVMSKMFARKPSLQGSDFNAILAKVRR